ncbi:metallophosphoesterase family protein [Emcibacter sp. SYSU 3D8]|uniref:metallophosphoesterase family protein n=1 Tax=Emcibacter sp. SYSU 3D8 TaxID=3133969 RepID=UPI0031FEBF5E
MLRRLFRSRTHATPQPAGAARIYAIGDIHGRLDLLRTLCARIEQDAADHAGPCTLVFLGDYVDRGPDSAGVIEFLLSGIDSRFDTVFLKGNHEDLWKRFLDEPEIGPAWFDTGGVMTVVSYGIREGLAGQSADFPAIAARLRAVMPPAHQAFLDGLALSHRSGGYLFAHAGIRPRVSIDRQDPQDLMWIRREFLNAEEFDGLCVVHGHSQVTEAINLPHRIAVDTGAYHSGRLTCVVLDGEDRRFVSTGG